jgi:hypothetical protein
MLMFPNSKTRQVGRVGRATLIATPASRGNKRLAPWPNAAIMDEEFKFHFNIYDESNVNRPRADMPHRGDAMCEWVAPEDGQRKIQADRNRSHTGLPCQYYARMIR